MVGREARGDWYSSSLSPLEEVGRGDRLARRVAEIVENSTLRILDPDDLGLETPTLHMVPVIHVIFFTPSEELVEVVCITADLLCEKSDIRREDVVQQASRR